MQACKEVLVPCRHEVLVPCRHEAQVLCMNHWLCARGRDMCEVVGLEAVIPCVRYMVLVYA